LLGVLMRSAQDLRAISHWWNRLRTTESLVPSPGLILVYSHCLLGDQVASKGTWPVVPGRRDARAFWRRGRAEARVGSSCPGGRSGAFLRPPSPRRAGTHVTSDQPPATIRSITIYI
jgi:hypothetical protein